MNFKCSKASSHIFFFYTLETSKLNSTHCGNIYNNVLLPIIKNFKCEKKKFNWL